jgi:hypothetical protein
MKRIAAKGGDGDAKKCDSDNTQKSTPKKRGRPKASAGPAAKRMKAATVAKRDGPDRTDSDSSE